LSSLKPEHRLLSVDLSRTVSLDSDGVGALIAVYKRLRERGGGVRLLAPLPFVREMLQLLRLDRLFEIIAD
jgi:anti-anti-sigma factor